MYRKFDFNDIVLVPKAVSPINSRKEITLFHLPLIASPMDTVIDDNTWRDFMFDGNMKVCMPRGVGKDLNTPGVFESLSFEDFQLYVAQLEANMNIKRKRRILVDIANGHMESMINWTERFMKVRMNEEIMVGNIANPQTYEEYAKLRVHYVRAGIGGGCFGKGTRILMSNGEYKNIEDILPNDKVINMDGEIVKVKRLLYQGKKSTITINSSMSPLDTIVTPDHKYYVGNYDKKYKDHKGYKLAINKQSWQEIGNYQNNLSPLFPNNIKFDILDNFEIDLKDYAINKKYCENYSTKSGSNYNLGYIFGTFLGDGNSKICINKRNCTSGSVHWNFGINEQSIIDKLQKCIFEEFNLKTNIKIIKNMKRVSLYNKPLSHLLSEFGKKQEKNLPSKFLVNNKEYLQGILDGLIDSDGSNDNGRISFYNTSIKLIEKFNIIYYLLNGVLPNSSIRINNDSKLCKNTKDAYFSRLLLNPDRRITKDNKYIINKINNVLKSNEILDVYDLEIDDNTHSFIADNCIVHNSACLTSANTGVHFPMASLINECYHIKKQHKYQTAIVADGGFRNYDEIIKALAIGADYVMLGGILNKCIEACAPTKLFGIRINYNLAKFLFRHKLFTNHLYKSYRGMSTKAVQKKWGKDTLKTAEGISKSNKVEYSVSQWKDNFEDYLRSAMSYCGAKNLEQFKDSEFVFIT